MIELSLIFALFYFLNYRKSLILSIELGLTLRLEQGLEFGLGLGLEQWCCQSNRSEGALE